MRNEPIYGLTRWLDYVHLNPVRATLIAAEAGLESFAWQLPTVSADAPTASSLVAGGTDYWARKASARILRREEKNSRCGWRYARRKEQSAEYHDLRRGWSLGSEEFRRELLAGMSEGLEPHHYGSQRQESGAEKAERLAGKAWQR